VADEQVNGFKICAVNALSRQGVQQWMYVFYLNIEEFLPLGIFSQFFSVMIRFSDLPSMHDAYHTLPSHNFRQIGMHVLLI
jgi:hypothetical protein